MCCGSFHVLNVWGPCAAKSQLHACMCPGKCLPTVLRLFTCYALLSTAGQLCTSSLRTQTRPGFSSTLMARSWQRWVHLPSLSSSILACLMTCPVPAEHSTTQHATHICCFGMYTCSQSTKPPAKFRKKTVYFIKTVHAVHALSSSVLSLSLSQHCFLEFNRNSLPTRYPCSLIDAHLQRCHIGALTHKRHAAPADRAGLSPRTYHLRLPLTPALPFFKTDTETLASHLPLNSLPCPVPPCLDTDREGLSKRLTACLATHNLPAPPLGRSGETPSN